MSDPNVLSTESNYFSWEFNTRLRLMKKGLLDFIDTTKTPCIEDQAMGLLKFNDMKAFAIISMFVSVKIQSMIRIANTASVAWEILRTFYMRKNMHNRVQKKDLYDFNLRIGGDIMNHFRKFDELCFSMQALGDVIGPDLKLVFCLEAYQPIMIKSQKLSSISKESIFFMSKKYFEESTKAW
uniref:AlNc14C272G9984 protein n=1 Tax=Albugo laibachii Nc14 TaxID=890382 RepID=F0WUH4_9STRA|nr:AlNc14C272G9984 [Albugo laibachii Nc14]|eukprot:CCA25054.1 AlNc14C272G9984 [Albugo laibachii Nc14]